MMSFVDNCLKKHTNRLSGSMLEGNPRENMGIESDSGPKRGKWMTVD